MSFLLLCCCFNLKCSPRESLGGCPDCCGLWGLCRQVQCSPAAPQHPGIISSFSPMSCCPFTSAFSHSRAASARDAGMSLALLWPSPVDTSTPGLQGGHRVGHQHFHRTERKLQDRQEALLKGTTAGSKGVWALMSFFKLQFRPGHRVTTREKLLVLAQGVGTR